MENLGVPLVDKPADLIGKVDGVLVESLEGGVHLERATPFLEAGLPCYIDKPFACSAADARKIVELADKHKVAGLQLVVAALRPGADRVPRRRQPRQDPRRRRLRAVAASDKEGRNPGLFHYGIHAVEILYTLMGPGCRR